MRAGELARKYQDSLLGKKIFFDHVRTEFRNGAIVMSLDYGFGKIVIHAFGHPNLIRSVDFCTKVRMDDEDFDDMQLPDYIRSAVRQRLRCEL